MKKYRKFTFTIIAGLLIVTTIYPTSAQAGQLASNGASISWDDSLLYLPTGCSYFYFDYSMGSAYMVEVNFMNKYGENLGVGGSGQGGTGQIKTQVCTFVSFEGARIELQVTALKGGINSQIVSAPVNFLSRAGSSVAPSKTTIPQPVPTVTVTATPMPAPTMTIYADESLVTKYNEVLAKSTIYKNLYTNANSKLKKICSYKPKPKGC